MGSAVTLLATLTANLSSFSHKDSEGGVLGRVVSPDLMCRSKPLWTLVTAPAQVSASETKVAAPCVRLIGHLDALRTLATRSHRLSWPTHKQPKQQKLSTKQQQ